jgi:YD repeat-containing protein
VGYNYDALNRLLSKTYSGDTSASPSSCYSYDGATNGEGRLTAQWTQKGACSSSPDSNALTKSVVSAYDLLGRVKSLVHCVLTSCTTDYPGQTTYSYDLAGHLTTYSDGIGGHYFTNSYDSAGRLSTVTSSWSDSVHPSTLFSAQSYTPSGGLVSAVYGNNLTLTRTYDSRLRITGETDVSSIGQSPAIPVTISISGAEKTIP